MTRLPPLILASALAGAVALANSAAPAAELSPEAHFQQRVWPLLERACVQCHGPEKQKAELRLDSREAALRGGEGGAALVPGKPAESLMFRLLRHPEPERDRMPPKQKLADAEVADVERWIVAGAPWPKPAAVPQLASGERLGDAWSDARNPIRRIFGGRRLDLWSLRPIRKPDVPPVKADGWSRNDIDRFILARLDRESLRPADEADRRTLLRRVTFGLTGMPPTPEEVSAFLEDATPGAYERAVDRLLASPRYGEHWARMWLDVVRYSDSNGFDWDEFRPQAWRYRDYVARSLNADKPFDRFIREQLAGDEMLAGAPRDAAEQDALIGTTFLRLGPHDNSAGGFGEERKVRQQLMADLVETTGSAFLGLTMSCCRCHDHKYDPLSQADHYRLQAFFESVKFRDDLPIDLADAQESIGKARAAVDLEIGIVRAKIAELTKATRTRLREARVAKLSEAERAVLETKDEANAKKRKKVEEKAGVPDEELRGALDPAVKKLVKEEEAKIAALEKKKPPFTTALLMTDREGEIAQTRILEGGNLDHAREAVPPGILSALDPNPSRIAPPARPGSTGRRSALAEWLVASENPLAARVLVNRVWQSHFGTGIVATPNDFGLAGATPSHPELLDWLATRFRESGWSLKQLHRLIVTSAAYRQRSNVPASGPLPDPALLARQVPRRVTAEMLRDAMLAVSGSLTESKGGPPVWPELPEDVLKANPAFLDDNKEKTKGWYPSPKEKTRVRSLYLIQKRTVPVPMMATFDLPDNSVSCARRNNSTVAPQALTLMNSEFVADAARAFAARVEGETGNDPAKQVQRVFALALQRQPDAAELESCVEFRASRSLLELCRVVLNLNEFIYID